jgi:glycosyltransferase involved in cell wall biosynthesis
LHILQLAPRLPYPLTDGGAIGIYKPTEAIAKLGHTITFVTFPDHDPIVTKEAVAKLSRFCTVELVNRPLPTRNATLLRTIFSGAYPIERRMMPEMYTLLERLLNSAPFDIVHIDGAQMGKYGLWIKEKFGLKVILREHNFESQIYSRFAENTRNPVAKIIARIHGNRLLHEETRFLNGLSGIVAISTEDKEQMQRLAPKMTFWVIPAGVDTDYFIPESIVSEEDTILWVGGTDWEPNRDAIEFFAKEIFPLIVDKLPHTTFTIIGKGTESLTTLVSESEGSKIQLLGRIPDIRTELTKAKVLICPLVVGGGMRLKLLDFFAAGKAIVSTSVGAEGNIGEDGVHLLVRNDPTSFANAVILLLENEDLRHRLGTNARLLAEKTYSWQSIASEFNQVYNDVLSRY